MSPIVASACVHIIRVVLAALAAGAIWAVTSVPISLMLRASDVTLGAFNVILIGVFFGSFIGAGYISAKFITPGSLLHAAAAGFLAMFVWHLVGGTGPWYYGTLLWVGAAGLCSGGAQIANRRQASSGTSANHKGGES
jgi:hypothetical protein